LNPIQPASTLTQSQLLIWTGQKLDPESPLYNVVFSYEITGKIDPEIVQRIFPKLVEQSDSMRTIFKEENGLPIQEIQANVEAELPIIDLSVEQDSEQALEEFIQRQSRIQFDLSKKVFYSALVKVNEQRWVWFLNIHHIVTDAWSFSILYTALADSYAAAVKGEVEPTISFPSFADYRTFEAKEHKRNVNQ